MLDRKRSQRDEKPFNLGQGSVYVVTILLILLSAYKLEYYPRIWFDEGEILQAPKNLVLYGKYALRSSEGFRVLDPALTTGPTVVLPIALAFKVFGVGLFQARLVMVAYLVLAVLAFYQLANHLYDRRTALVALWLFIGLSGPAPSLFSLGRQALGNVPALFFFLTGALLWMKSIDIGGRDSKVFLFLSGMFMGLAMVTKNQYGLLIPVMIIVWAVDRLYYKKLCSYHFAIPLAVSVACQLTWYGVQFAILGGDEFAGRMGDLQAVSSTSVAVFSTGMILENLRKLVTTEFLILGVPSLIYVVLSCAARELSSLKRVFVLSFVGVWLSWYLLASVGWERYLFDPWVATCICVAKVFSDLTEGVGESLRRLWGGLIQREPTVSSPSIAASLILVFVVLYPFQQTVRSIIFARQDAPQEFARFLDSHVSTDVIVESWEWELGFLTGHNYHFPPTQIVLAMIRKLYSGVPYPVDAYHFQDFDPDYLIDGPFSKSTGLYPQGFLKQSCTLVKSIGDYDLYKIQKR